MKILHVMRTSIFIALKLTQHSWALDPSQIKAQLVRSVQSHMAISMISPGLVPKSSPCLPCTNALHTIYQPILCLELTPFVLCGPTSLAFYIEWLE